MVNCWDCKNARSHQVPTQGVETKKCKEYEWEIKPQDLACEEFEPRDGVEDNG
jgi:hypothetical protein